ncbi:MBL fold metallo-hydrolase [Enterovirga aerilata]|uniref:MBL fold metallo-hydrolase n=1 Tax=Enterovirga aerilata TaxID=2730920 RepID=A0A849I7N2_9HYPH|nr:MBL fold metallo-hydrolase [Enterovirga sp. DB1703]NNM72080.1 MBL fold metallo-hydrolase [Enterovirga sp. DB1703]
MSFRLTILGCGSSAGVPRVGMGWGAADPNNPKNHRRRCSVLVERQGSGGRTSVLIDTSPDLREQLLSADVRRLDAVLITHDHADHTHGIDDLRPLVIHMRRRMPVFSDEATSRVLHERFGYCFATPPGSDYPPILDDHRIDPDEPVGIEGPGGRIEALPFMVEHGRTPALGFRFGPVAYLPDVSAVPAKAKARLANLDILILDALRYTPHPTHFSVAEALAFIAEIRPRRSVLTNMHTDIDFETIRRELPDGVEPAYDGLQLEWPS